MPWILAGLVGALTLAPFFVRALRNLRGSPELKATLHAAAIGILLELIPLLVLLIRSKGQRRPRQ
jgi:hypothetical protein